MFEELPFILGFMVFSGTISYILIKYTTEPILKIIQAIGVVGIVIHELCHLFMCVISHTPIERVSLVKKYKSDNIKKVTYYGEVKVYEHKTSFLQAFLVSFAPLYISFWLFFSLLNFLFSNQVEPLTFFLCIFIMISLVLSAAPSFADLAIIPKAFQNNSRHSLYQLLLISSSILITWIIISVYNLQFIHEIFIYLIIGGIYFLFKYSCLFTRNLLYLINSRINNFKRPHKVNIKKFTRKTYKPKKPRGDPW